MYDKKAIALLRKYYLPYKTDSTLTEKDIQNAIAAGVLVPNDVMTHDEIIDEIKALSQRISLEDTAKSFLYSLSTGDTRYRTALSSLIWARALPEHKFITNNDSVYEWKHGGCSVCGCAHGVSAPEEIDFNRYGVFRYLPPVQYGNQPDFGCAEYVLNDLREFEKLPAVLPCDNDYYILNRIFGAVMLMKSHNKASALIAEIRRQKLLNTTGNGIHCLLGVLSMCGILESEEEKGYLHRFTNGSGRNFYMDNDLFYPLNHWKGKYGINYSAVNEIFGSFCGDKLDSDKAVSIDSNIGILTGKTNKKNSKAEQYFKENEYIIDLNDRYRCYYGISPISDSWDRETMYSVTHEIKKRTILFFEGNTIKKYIYEEYSAAYSYYEECDLNAETDSRKLLLPKTSRGRAKPLTPSMLRTPTYMCGHLIVHFSKDGNGGVTSFNSSNDQLLPLPPDNISSRQDFIDYTEKYIESCPKEYENVLNNFRIKTRAYIKFKAGDIFRVQLTPTLYTYCLILGRVREILKWEEIPPNHPLQSIMCQPIAFRQYDIITDDPNMTADTLKKYPLLITKYAQDNEILFETYPIVCRKHLEPSDIDFGFCLENELLVWGLTVHELTDDELSLMPIWSKWCEKRPADVSSFSFYCGVYINVWYRELKKGRISTDEYFDYYNEAKKMIIQTLSLSPSSPEDDFAVRYGGITREQYIRLADERFKK